MKGEIWVGYVSKLCKKNMTHFSRDRFPGGIFVGIFEGRHRHEVYEVVFFLSITPQNGGFGSDDFTCQRGAFHVV